MYQNPYIKLKPKTRYPYTEIYLVRHCNPNYRLQKEVGEDNMPLSKVGLKQRQYLTKKLLTLGLDKVYTSTLKRAQETSAEFVRKTKVDVSIDNRLDEINWTNWYRIKYFNMSEKAREQRLVRHKILDKELDKMQVNVRRALADIWRHSKGKKVGVFCHGNFIKALLTGILNADVIGFLSLEIFQSSITKLVVDRDGYIKISSINDVSHLPLPPKEDLFVTLID